MNKNILRNYKKKNNEIICSSSNLNSEKSISDKNIIELFKKSFKLEDLKNNFDNNINLNKNLEFSKYIKIHSIDDKIIFLKLLLEELYLDTKLDKFKSDSIFLEKWLWALSDKKKIELNINL
jgi:hypothetical protein